MADRSHLTPTRTVDRRGRLTTVYRSFARLLRAEQTAAPPTPKPTVRPASDLPAIRPRSRKELETFAAGSFRPMAEAIRRTLSTAEGRLAGSLALDMIEQGRLRPDQAEQLLWPPKAEGGGGALDTLRVIAYLQDHMGRTEIPSALLFRISALRIVGTPRTMPPITTRRELEATAAVAEFTVQMIDAPNGKALITVGAAPSGSEYRDGEQLEDLIRRRPEDVHRIARIMIDRSGNGFPSASDVEAWLDNGVPALDDGLL